MLFKGTFTESLTVNCPRCWYLPTCFDTTYFDNDRWNKSAVSSNLDI